MICPICTSNEFVHLDFRPRVPIFQNKVWPDVAAALAAPTGVLDMKKCSHCGFAWNAAFDENLITYDLLYDNDQTQSAVFQSHMMRMAARVMSKTKDGSSIVEIGCGQEGKFVEVLSLLLPKGSALFGFDPSWRGENGGGPAGSKIYREYFSPETASLVPAGADIIVARHTIEHIKDPVSFLSSIRDRMTANPDARLFLETPDIDWIVAHRQVQDLFYEHCSIFSRQAFAIALWKSGFEPISIENVFGGQYLWVEARPLADPLREARLNDYVTEAIASWHSFIDQQKDPVYLWGAASKGVTFSLLLKGNGIAGVIDINPKKIGHHLAVTGLPVIAPSEIPDSATVIIMNPNYAREIMEMTSMRPGIRLFVLDLQGAISQFS